MPVGVDTDDQQWNDGKDGKYQKKFIAQLHGGHLWESILRCRNEKNDSVRFKNPKKVYHNLRQKYTPDMLEYGRRKKKGCCERQQNKCII